MKGKAGKARATARAAALCCATLMGGALAAPMAWADAPSPAPKVLVSGVTFEGNHTYTSATLSGLIASEIGKPMTLKQIRELAEQVADFYHRHGYRLVKVVVPQQTFGNDKPVKLVVLEGQLGKIVIQGNRRYAASRIRAALSAYGVEEGQPIRLSRVERALTSLNRQSGITTKATLRPGTEQGYTDLQIDVQEAPRVNGSVEVNNYGSKDTGRYRVIPHVEFQNLTGRGDDLNLIAMKSLGSGDAHFEYGDYQTPVNAHGMSVEVYASGGNVNVGRDFKVLDIKGDSTSAGIGLHQDQILSARTILTYSAWLEGTDLKQKMLGTTVADDKVRKLRLGVKLDHSDLFGRTLLSMDLHQGLGEHLGGMQNDSTQSSRSYAGADNRFTKITFDFTRIQRLNARTVVIPRLYGQYAFEPLVSSEQWAIGGVNSVKGHPPSVYSGDSGFTASVEARYDLFSDNHRYQLIGGLSHGRVYIRKPFIGQASEEHISGISVGVMATPVKPLELRLDWGIPLGKSTGDNSYVYAQAQYRF